MENRNKFSRQCHRLSQSQEGLRSSKSKSSSKLTMTGFSFTKHLIEYLNVNSTRLDLLCQISPEAFDKVIKFQCNGNASSVFSSSVAFWGRKRILLRNSCYTAGSPI